jgi:hypothetical protein
VRDDGCARVKMPGGGVHAGDASGLHPQADCAGTDPPHCRGLVGREAWGAALVQADGPPAVTDATRPALTG